MSETERKKAAAAIFTAVVNEQVIEWLEDGVGWLTVDPLSPAHVLNVLSHPQCYRVKPWTLPAPPAGKQWQAAQEWKEEWLPAGYRPLFEGEVLQEGDEYFCDYKQWEPTKNAFGAAHRIHFPYRTRRPLPAEPVTRPWSKPEDVPLNCWLGWEDPDSSSAEGAMVVVVHGNGVSVAQKDEIIFLSWSALERKETLHSTDRKTWLPCVTQKP